MKDEMTNRLVRGLRLIESGHYHGLGDVWLKKTGGGAADEIERLRDANGYAFVELAKARAEVERLKALTGRESPPETDATSIS
jgi:hypothetical protein